MMFRRVSKIGVFRMSSLARSTSLAPSYSPNYLQVNGTANSENVVKKKSDEINIGYSTPQTQQATESEVEAWLQGPVGLMPEVAAEYAERLVADGFDSAASISLLSVQDLERRRIRTGHAMTMLERVDALVPIANELENSQETEHKGPRFFDFATIKEHVKVEDAIEAVEEAFGKLAQGQVDVPLPMHIGINETDEYGPGDCHIKGGYVSGAPTFTVKLAMVSFYKNLERGLPPGAGVFVVVCAKTGATLAVMQENRYLTDLRTGAAGALAVKYLTRGDQDKTIAFIGCGQIAKNMARASHAVKSNFEAVAFDPNRPNCEAFASTMSEELGLSFEAVSSAHEACRRADIIFTQTPGGATVLERRWLKPHATIIASGSDQPTKQELPVDLISHSKYVADLTRQTAKVGELRSAIQAGAMTIDDVHAELGQIINGEKPGRTSDNELIVVDLTGTGGQDAAIGSVAWSKLSKLP